MTPERKGEALLPKVGCLSCHKLDDRDGRVGPELGFTSLQRDRGWVMAHFEDPKGVVPGSLMPPYPLPGETFESLTAYLLTRPVPAVAPDPARQYAELCARCHGDEGRGDGVIAAYIDPAPRDLTKASFVRTKTRERLVTSVKTGVAGTSMAPWGRVLGEEGSARLLDFVLEAWSKGAQARPPAGREILATNPVPWSAESVARGDATYLDRCWGCHGKKADGHVPNADHISPRPRNLRARAFVDSIPYARLHESIKYGVQGTAMPAAGFDFALNEAAIGDLVNYILSLNRLGPDGAKVTPGALHLVPAG